VILNVADLATRLPQALEIGMQIETRTENVSATLKATIGRETGIVAEIKIIALIVLNNQTTEGLLINDTMNHDFLLNLLVVSQSLQMSQWLLPHG